MIRVAIVADSPVLRAGLRTLLDAGAELEMENVNEEDADVVLWAPHGSATRDSMRWTDDADLDARHSRVPTVVLLEQMDAEVRREAYAGGASAVLPIDVHGNELIAAVRAAANGLIVMQPSAAAELTAGTHHPRRRTDSRVSLTPRELEVLTLLARGLANKGMGQQLGITEHTVKTHVAAVYEKLGAGNRAEAVVAAARQGLIMI